MLEELCFSAPRKDLLAQACGRRDARQAGEIMETVEILAKVLAELIRRLREHRLLTDADVLALTAILKKMEARLRDNA
jgi:hypothetical protein